MAQNHKRKFGDYRGQLDSADIYNSAEHGQEYEGVGQLLARLKDQSASDDASPSSSNLSKILLNKSNQGKGPLSQEYPSSQAADLSKVFNPKRKRAGHEKDRIKYPELTLRGAGASQIRIADLQALALYTLSDGVAPNWIAFKHAHHTRKVLVLMVPGLEQDMFGAVVQPENESGRPENSTLSKISLEGCAEKSHNARREDLDPDKDLKHTAGLVSHLVQPLVDVFRSFWPAKSPGDSRYSKVHSPIQAMLVSQLPKSKESKGLKGPRPPAEERTWDCQPVAVTEVIHTLDELHQADYPLHDALFDGDTEAARIEKERRDKTGQNSLAGWVDTPVLSYADRIAASKSKQQPETPADWTVYAVDCEMVLTSDDKSSLTRISIVGWDGKTVLDELVKPELAIKNYFTQYSGMTKELLDPVKTTLAEIQPRLLQLFTPQTVLLGHSLESDLAAMKLTHPFIVDTSLIYPHPRGPPLRSSLRFLSQKYLRRDIQQQDVKGHDSVEDALAVLDLVKLKCEKGLKWGTSEAGGEPIFRRLARHTRNDTNGNTRGVTSAMVDYGTPERGYGKEATVQIGCNSDTDIVKAVARAVNGDTDGEVVPGGGVDFTWARLRELEIFRGWCNNNRDYGSVGGLHGISRGGLAPTHEAKSQEGDHEAPHAAQKVDTKNGSQKLDPDGPPDSQTYEKATLSSAVRSTVSHILAIHDALPPCTLFIVYTGTGDPCDVGRLQGMRQQFQREYKVKRWDDLSIKWTDMEDQALKKAAEKARQGLAFMCIK
jgi:RNA exonuclease 1